MCRSNLQMKNNHVDIFKSKRQSKILYKAYKKNIIYGLNTVIHNKNFFDYQFNIPGLKVIHDYNYIYPVETKANKDFLLDMSKTDIIVNTVIKNFKSLLMDLNTLSAKQLVLKYPPYLFVLFNNVLSFYKNTNIKAFDPKLPLCAQTSCLKLDIYGNKICGKGRETDANQLTPLGETCASCRYCLICSFKCPMNKFDRSLCRDSYIYKIYFSMEAILSNLLKASSVNYVNI